VTGGAAAGAGEDGTGRLMRGRLMRVRPRLAMPLLRPLDLRLNQSLSRGGDRGKGRRGEKMGGRTTMAVMDGDVLVKALEVKVGGTATTSPARCRSAVDGVGVERHLEGYQRGDGNREQEKRGEERRESERQGKGRERKTRGEERRKWRETKTLIQTHFSHPLNRTLTKIF
jgi:hypothetical protein